MRATLEEIQQRQTSGRVIRSMPFESLENALAQLPADTLAKLCLTDDPRVWDARSAQREWLYRTAQVAPAGRALDIGTGWGLSSLNTVRESILRIHGPGIGLFAGQRGLTSQKSHGGRGDGASVCDLRSALGPAWAVAADCGSNPDFRKPCRAGCFRIPALWNLRWWR